MCCFVEYVDYVTNPDIKPLLHYKPSELSLAVDQRSDELLGGAEIDAAELAEAHYILGCRTALQGEWQISLDHFLAAIKLDRSVRDDGGRLGALDIFNVLGQEHEITREYQRKLSSLLF